MPPPGVDRIEGYRDPAEYVEHKHVVVLLNVSLLVVVTELFFPGLVANFLSALPFNYAEFREFVTVNQNQILLITGFIAVLIGIHELVHYAVHRVNGFAPEFGVKFVWFWKIPNPAPYVVVLDEPLTRRENVTALIAPLMVINAVGLAGLLPLFPGVVNYLAAVALVFNTSGSSADIYHSIRVSRYPRGTLFQNVETEKGVDTYWYEPEGGSVSVSSGQSGQSG